MILPDLIAPGLDILFCGTAPGPTSAAKGHYYAGNGNKFWKLLAATGLTPRLLCPDQDHLLPGFGLGLTDLAKEAAGVDRDIDPVHYTPVRLMALIRRIAPRCVAFTSLTAARLACQDTGITAGRFSPPPVLAHVTLWALPSPSGANVHFTAAPWHDLAAWRMAWLARAST